MTAKKKVAEQQLQQVDWLIAKLESAAAEHPKPSTFANIRSLEKERRVLQQSCDMETAMNRSDELKGSTRETVMLLGILAAVIAFLFGLGWLIGWLFG